MRSLVDAHVGEVVEVLPERVRVRQRLPALVAALRRAHFPETESELAAAHRRLAFDDFLFLQLGLAILRARTTRARGIALAPPGQLVGACAPRSRTR